MNLREAAESFIEDVERAEANADRPKTGMQVPYHGPFAHLPPSMRGGLRWYADRFREAIEAEKTRDIDPESRALALRPDQECKP